MATISHPVIRFDKMPLYPLQQTILDHPARYKVVALGRQSGKSYLARTAALSEGANKGGKVWWVAPTISTAKEHWDELVALIQNANFPVVKTSLTDKQIDFVSGGFIRIRSADTPANLRGTGLNFLIMDEAAFMHSDVWFKILWATLTATRGEAMFLTTPNGRNWLYQLYKLGLDPEEETWMSWNAPSWDSPYQDVEELKRIKKVTPSHIYRQEYGAEFLSDAGGVFTGVDNVAVASPVLKPQPDGIYMGGIDWGDSNDATSVTIIDKNRMRQVFGARFEGLGQIETVSKVAAILQYWMPERTYIEFNGIGGPLLKQLRLMLNPDDQDSDALLRHSEAIYTPVGKLIPVYTTNSVKRELVEKLAVLVEYGRLKLLREEADEMAYGTIQLNEMSTFERYRTPAGNDITYRASGKNHDDTVMALVFAAKGLPYIHPDNVGDLIATHQNKRAREAVEAPMKNPFRGSGVRYARGGTTHARRR